MDDPFGHGSARFGRRGANTSHSATRHSASTAGPGASVAAVDLGATSGRVVVVGFDGHQLTHEVMTRFAHAQHLRDGRLTWDLGRILHRAADGVAQAASRYGAISSVGVDSWGVDYALLDNSGRLLALPGCYRGDPGREPYERMRRTGALENFYAATGVLPMAINTAFQLMAEPTDCLGRADRLLLIPDLVHHSWSGAAVTERTIASTTGLLDLSAGGWSATALSMTGLPPNILPDVVPPGTDLGPLVTAADPALDHRGLHATRVVAPAGHDTACAVVAAPLTDPNDTFISLGTWALVGRESGSPVVEAKAIANGIGNECGYGGTILTMANVTGLWLLEECRHQWRREGSELPYGQLLEEAARTEGTRVIDVDAPNFAHPADMPAAIVQWCRDTGQQHPATPGEITRIVLDSIAIRCARAVHDLEDLLGPTRRIVVVGGGVRNALLTQLIADASGLPVLVGPDEATSLGNGAIQLVAAGEFSSVAEIRRVVAERPGEIRSPRHTTTKEHVMTPKGDHGTTRH